jgi:predicted cation transporter
MKAGEFILAGMFLVFLGLKLAGVEPVAAWSWWWVTAPLWGPIAIVAAIGIPVAIVYFLVVALKNARDWRRT